MNQESQILFISVAMDNYLINNYIFCISCKPKTFITKLKRRVFSKPQVEIFLLTVRRSSRLTQYLGRSDWIFFKRSKRFLTVYERAT